MDNQQLLYHVFLLIISVLAGVSGLIQLIRILRGSHQSDNGNEITYRLIGSIAILCFALLIISQNIYPLISYLVSINREQLT